MLPMKRVRLSRFLAFGLLYATAVVSSGAAPWKFAIFSDGRAGSPTEHGSTNGVHVATLRLLAADAARQNISLVIFPGDLVNGGSNFGPLDRQFSTWKEAMKPLYDAGVAVYPCRGNHETHQDEPAGSAIQAWRAAFPNLPHNGPEDQRGLTYKVETNNACFIAFEQFAGRSANFDPTRYDSQVNSGMVPKWALDQILQTKARWVFAFGHESAFIGHHTDCLANVPAERDALWDALGAKGGIYVSGHDHLYARRTAPDANNRPVMELVAGDAGAPGYPYDNVALNANYDRHVVPTDLFVNAGPVAKSAPPDYSKNTNHYPMYFGYVLITVDDTKITGGWRALTNYDTAAYPENPPDEPKFETLDAFSWP